MDVQSDQSAHIIWLKTGFLTTLARFELMALENCQEGPCILGTTMAPHKQMLETKLDMSHVMRKSVYAICEQ